MLYPKMEGENNSRAWIGIAAVLAIAIGVGSLWLFMQRPVEPLPPAEEEEAPVVSPEVDRLEDLAQYTEGRPLPVATTTRSTKIYRDDHIRGNRNAVISIIEISSLHNLYSGLMHPALKQLVEERSDVNWVFRHFPDEEDPLEHPASYASECVALQKGEEGFWNYLDLSSPHEINTEADVVNIGVQAGANRAELEECLANRTTVRDVAFETMLNIQEADPTSVPTFLFLHNETGEIRYMQGADTMAFVNKVLDEMLKN